MALKPSRLSHKPGFFWQGLLILLPVTLLVGVGILSLRHDKLVAEHEAKKRAAGLADTLAQRLWTEVALTNMPPGKGIAFLVDSNSNLLIPPGCATTPTPRTFDTGLLNSNQARLWTLAEVSEHHPDSTSSAIAAYREFLDSDPPGQFAASALFSLGLLLAKENQAADAITRFQLLVDQYPGAVGESGLPLAPLARLKMAELSISDLPTRAAQETAALESLCSNLVWRPTLVSTELLRRLKDRMTTSSAGRLISTWQRTWDEHESARECFSILLSTGALTNSQSMSRAFWCSAEQNWLVMTVTNSPGTWYSCRTEEDISRDLDEIVKQEKQIPDYFGVGIEVAGKRLTWPAPDLRMWDYVDYFGRAGGGQKKQYSTELATNVLAWAEPGGARGTLRATIYLRSPGALFARERARVFWFAALIASAAIAAGVGFFTAYRAFNRQLRLSEMKSNFVSSVSHELRAPIASVRLMAESLEKGKIAEPAKQQDYFRFIRQECRRLSSLVENVLDFSRIEQGRKQYEFEPTDVTTLTSETVKLMRTYAEEKDVQLDLQIDLSTAAECQPVLDGKAIQQALINLIDNAVKHSPKGATVVVGLECVAGNSPAADACDAAGVEQEDRTLGRNIRLWVEDKGPGIPASEHQKIFERFYRLGSELRRETQGVGIGLSIVRHVVDAHHGRVVVRSELGQGSRFTIELPLVSQNGAPGPTK